MSHRITRITSTLVNLALASAAIAFAQSPAPHEIFTIPLRSSSISNWEVAQQVGSSNGKLFVVTLDQPERKQTCRIHAFTKEKLICYRALGSSRTYSPQQVLALILPGDGCLKLRLAIGLNAALGTAIWGTVVFVATCPGCAVAAGIAALVFFIAAAGILAADDQPDRLLYLAPEHQLTGKLRYVEPVGVGEH